jgi:hypothetical protein
MKKYVASIFMFLIVVGANSQMSETLVYATIRVNGIAPKATLEELMIAFGEPDTAFDPKFDCGFYSTESQDIESVQLLKYADVEFLLVDGRAEFREVYFQNESDITLVSNEIVLSKDTSLDQLMAYFPIAYETWLTDEYSMLRLLPCDYCDSEIWLHIENDRIKRIQFWDPC